jgi:hypothetical protein
MDAIPAALGVNVTEHAPATSVQLGALKVPARPLAVNPTDPAGVVAPAPLVSATVAVQVEGWLIGTLPGLHTTVVEVVRRVAVTEPLVVPLLALPPWTPSLGVYVPVIDAVPAALGVKATEQVPAAESVQLVALKVPASPLAVNPTEPAGVVAPAPPMSVTVAVQVEGWLMATVPGLQTTDVDVGRVTVLTEPLLAPLLALPA